VTVLDTNVLILLATGKLATQLPPQTYLVSVISKIEMLAFPRITAQEERALLDLIQDLTIVGLDDDVVAQAIQLKRATSLRLPDAIIAATAIVAQAELMTMDKGFLNVPGLRVTPAISIL